MGRSGLRREIGILIYPGAQLAAIHGLTDFFLMANRVVGTVGDAASPTLRISHWSPANPQGAVGLVFDTDPDRPSRPEIIIIPPSLAEPITPEAASALARWLREWHASGTILASVCAGAFVLAETGLLDSRRATTHWGYTEAFARRFPKVTVDTGPLIIDDGDIVTAGGVMPWTDLALRLIERLLGPTVLAETARAMLVDPGDRSQRPYSLFSPRLNHGDKAILAAQHWLQGKGACDVSVKSMADQAGLGERTFIRRFHAATGLNPTEYCQNVRIGKARLMLESSNRSVDEIAWEVGYRDASAFRRVFIKVVGLKPGLYRDRFGVGKARGGGAEE